MAIKCEVDDFPGRDSYVRLWPDKQELSEWLAFTIRDDGTVYVSARSKDTKAALDVVRVDFRTVMIGIK
ncbi:MAG: hypothetical protein ACR2RF_25290 [Geminicoccaceae bacterium]